MENRMRAVIARHGGLATAQMLAEVGIDDRLLNSWLKRSVVLPIRRGVYTTPETWAAWDPYDARPWARVRAARYSLRVRHVLSHDSAALAHGLRLIAADESAVHISRPDMRGFRSGSGICHHGARFTPDQVELVRGAAVLDVPRTVADLARRHGYREGLVAADGALRQGIGRHDLLEVAETMRGWPDSLVVRAVAEDADEGAESAGETLARELALELGLDAEIETQFPVQLREGVAWCDLRVGRHLIEFDGRLKYRSPEDGGVADRELEQIVWDERRRQSEVCAGGFGMTRLVWADFWGAARARALDRLAREYAVTVARFGARLTPQQAAFAQRHRGGRRPSAA
jgi:hypothetical protein